MDKNVDDILSKYLDILSKSLYGQQWNVDDILSMDKQ